MIQRPHYLVRATEKTVREMNKSFERIPDAKRMRVAPSIDTREIVLSERQKFQPAKAARPVKERELIVTVDGNYKPAKGVAYASRGVARKVSVVMGAVNWDTPDVLIVRNR